MPRNRRAAVPKKRPHPKAEDIIDENIDPGDKNVKVDLLLRDFDKGVENRIKELEAAHKKLLRTMTRQYHVVRRSFTEDVLNMKFSDFLATLATDVGEVKRDITSSSENEADISEHEEEDEDCNKIMQTVLKKKGKRNVLGAISESATTPATLTRTSKRTVNRAPPRTVTRNAFQTPAVTFGKGRPGWETPMVTPKFDPRLPVTTARRPRRGEGTITSVFMSEKGSPIHAAQPLLTIPLSANPNQGVSLFGSERPEAIKKMFENCDPVMKENLKKMAKLMSMLTEHS